MWHIQYNTCGYPSTGFFSIRGSESDDNRILHRYHGYIPYDVISGDGTQSQSIPSPSTDSNTFSWSRGEYSANPIAIVSDHETKTGCIGEVQFTPNAQITSDYTRNDEFPHPLKVRPSYREIGFKRMRDSKSDEELSNVERTSRANDDLDVLLYGNHWQIFWAVTVRFLLIAHNVLTVWRVVEAYTNPLYWTIALCNMALLLELMVVVVKRAGVDYSWWTPSFLIYLASTLPAIWLLQLELYVEFTANKKSEVILQNGTQNSPYVDVLCEDSDRVIRLDNNLWIIIIQESLVYLLVFSRWLLPRGRVTRAFLADLLLEFLAIASDIMELLVVFEEDEIRGNLGLTYVILAVWSASFIQFIPVLMHKRRFRHVRNPRMKCLTRLCGETFVEMVVTFMSIFLQDLPFLVVRLYVIFKVQIISYSLIFFVLKNAVTLLLLFYRLFVIIRHLPLCKRTVKSEENI